MDFHSTRPLVLLVAFGSGLAFSEACKSSKANSNHCSLLDGDDTCAERYPGELVHCGGDCVDSENGDGCVMDAPTDLECWYPCGDDQTAEDDMSCLGTTMTDTIATTVDSTDSDPSGDPTTADTTATTMGSMTDASETDATDTTEGGGDCQTSDECLNAAFPVCLDHECVACTDTPDGNMACAAKDEALSVCAETGECVQCNDGNAAACSGTTPVCDAGTSSCVGCTYHEQCSETACDIETGACFDDTCITEVDGDNGDEIGPAIADGCVLIIHDAAGGYPESVEIGPGITVALLAAEGQSPLIGGIDDNGLPSVSITGDAVVYVQGLRINGNDLGIGTTVDAGTLYVDRSEMVGNDGGGLLLTNGATGEVRSSVIGGNGSNVNPNSVGVVVDGSELHMTGVTIAANDRQAAMPASLSCVDSMVTVRNSIVAALDPMSIVCGGVGVVITYSALDTDIAGTGNVVLPAFDFDWFDDVATSQFHLGPNGSAFADVALMELADYPFDIDGDPRAPAGSMDYAGADVP